jgi:sulfate transport system permease protein
VRAAARDPLADPLWLKALVLTLGLGFMAAMIVLPVIEVFGQALAKGLAASLRAVADPDTLAAVRLTLLTAAVVVPLNTLIGICAAWALAKHEVRGGSLILALLDLPLSVSPVVAGLAFVLVFGLQGWLGGALEAHGVKVIFAVPGIVLATTFVTLPFVARELVPLMQAQGAQEEEAAVSLGAGGPSVFLRVTLPNVRWGLLYGVILCNARAMGEFGAVSVVSGRIRGATDTLPLQVEALYGDYDFVAAFSVAGLLSLLAVATLILKTALERLMPEETADAA